MTGLERNSEVVQMAAYAPLFVHVNFVKWPTNLIVIDNHRRGMLLKEAVLELNSSNRLSAPPDLIGRIPRTARC